MLKRFLFFTLLAISLNTTALPPSDEPITLPKIMNDGIFLPQDESVDEIAQFIGYGQNLYTVFVPKLAFYLCENFEKLVVCDPSARKFRTHKQLVRCIENNTLHDFLINALNQMKISLNTELFIGDNSVDELMKFNNALEKKLNDFYLPLAHSASLEKIDAKFWDIFDIEPEQKSTFYLSTLLDQKSKSAERQKMANAMYTWLSNDNHIVFATQKSAAEIESFFAEFKRYSEQKEQKKLQFILKKSKELPNTIYVKISLLKSDNYPLINFMNDH
ncbi:MAG: hypothetical protein H6731_07240 [Myxococcales bacterium]|nr:MAG: hypothetical protein H6731_07240 [Myxococcales bacterium]